MYLVVCNLKRNIIIPLYSIHLLPPLFRHQKEVGQHNLLRNISHGSFAQIPSGANLQAMANAAANRNSNQHLNVPEITVGGLVTIKASINATGCTEFHANVDYFSCKRPLWISAGDGIELLMGDTSSMGFSVHIFKNPRRDPPREPTCLFDCQKPLNLMEIICPW